MKALTLRKRLLAALIAVTVVLGSVQLPTPSVAQAAVVSDFLLTQGEGSFSGTLATGKDYSIVNASGVPTFTVAGEKFGTGVTDKVAWCSSILLWEDQALAFVSSIGGTDKKGNLAVIDLKSNWNTMFWLTYDESTTSKLVTNRKVGYVADGAPINGNGTANNTYKTSIFLSRNTFYMMFGSGSTAYVVEKELPTRKELADIYGIDPDVTDTPTPAPTQEPRVVPTVAPATKAPVVVPTLAPQTKAPTPTLAPLPTFAPHTFAPDPTGVKETTKIDVEFWWEKYWTRQITWDQLFEIVWGYNIDTQTHTESSTELTAKFWWEKFSNKEISWEQLKELVWGNQWQATSTTDSVSTTYYLFDKNGNKIGEQTTFHEEKSETGTESGTSQEKDSGSATVKEEEKGDGGATVEAKTTTDSTSHTEAQGQATIHNTGTATEVGHEVGQGGATIVIKTTGSTSSSKATKKSSKASKKSSKKKVVGYSVRRPSNPKKAGYIALVVHYSNGKSATKSRVYYNPSKKLAIFDGRKYWKTNRVGFTQTSNQIDLWRTSGKITITARGKGSSKYVWKDRTLKTKASYINVCNDGRDNRYIDKKGRKHGLKGIQAKKIKKAKAKKAKA